MSTEIIQVTIDYQGNVSLSKDPVTITKPTRILWLLHPASQKDWKMAGIELSPSSPGLKDQLIDWDENPDYGMISALDVCTADGGIKYSILYRRKYPAGPLRRYDPIIENRPPRIATQSLATDEVIVPVDIAADGTVLSPAKDDVVVVQGPKAPGKNYKVKIKWQLTEQAQEHWELVDLGWRAPAPPDDEFFDKTKSSSKKGCSWIRVKDKNDTAGTFVYSLIYKSKSSSELLVFDPIIENVPPRIIR